MWSAHQSAGPTGDSPIWPDTVKNMGLVALWAYLPSQAGVGCRCNPARGSSRGSSHGWAWEVLHHADPGTNMCGYQISFGETGKR